MCLVAIILESAGLEEEEKPGVSRVGKFFLEVPQQIFPGVSLGKSQSHACS